MTDEQKKEVNTVTIALAMELLGEKGRQFSMGEVVDFLVKKKTRAPRVDPGQPGKQTPEYGMVNRCATKWVKWKFLAKHTRNGRFIMFSIKENIHLSSAVRRKESASKRAKAVTKPPLLTKEMQTALPVPALAQAPPHSHAPESLNGLPYVPNSELRTHLGKVIEGLEMIKDHIQPTLTLLLDLDRDFDRYNKAKVALNDLHAQIERLKI